MKTAQLGIDFDEGARRRDVGHADALTHVFVGVIRAAILHVAKTAQTFTSEDVVAILPADAAKALERFPNVLGACFRAEAKAGTIQLTGAYQAARRPEARKRRLAVWKAP